MVISVRATETQFFKALAVMKILPTVSVFRLPTGNSAEYL